jgi:GNAT superfamily N-acetyltransferase
MPRGRGAEQRLAGRAGTRHIAAMTTDTHADLASISADFPQVRQATDADVEHIHSWLEIQQAADVPGTFLCNWNLTLRVHAEGRLAVYADPATNSAVGYQWGGLLRPGILEVRADLRGRGIGRTLTQYRLAQAWAQDEDVLYIDCKPSTSISFWQRMGFQLVSASSSGKNYAYRIVPRPLTLPEGMPVRVRIEFFAEDRKWTPTLRPFSAFTPVAVRDEHGDVWLAERVHVFDGGYDRHNTVRDIVARVEIDGKEVFLDKIKYDEALNMGFNECVNGYYVDVLST